jgi:hypothetical protein
MTVVTRTVQIEPGPQQQCPILCLGDPRSILGCTDDLLATMAQTTIFFSLVASIVTDLYPNDSTMSWILPSLVAVPIIIAFVFESPLMELTGTNEKDEARSCSARCGLYVRSRRSCVVTCLDRLLHTTSREEGRRRLFHTATERDRARKAVRTSDPSSDAPLDDAHEDSPSSMPPRNASFIIGTRSSYGEAIGTISRVAQHASPVRAVTQPSASPTRARIRVQVGQQSESKRARAAGAAEASQGRAGREHACLRSSASAELSMDASKRKRVKMKKKPSMDGDGVQAVPARSASSRSSMLAPTTLANERSELSEGNRTTPRVRLRKRAGSFTDVTVATPAVVSAVDM